MEVERERNAVKQAMRELGWENAEVGHIRDFVRERQELDLRPSRILKLKEEILSFSSQPNVKLYQPQDKEPDCERISEMEFCAAVLCIQVFGKNRDRLMSVMDDLDYKWPVITDFIKDNG